MLIKKSSLKLFLYTILEKVNNTNQTTTEFIRKAVPSDLCKNMNCFLCNKSFNQTSDVEFIITKPIGTKSFMVCKKCMVLNKRYKYLDCGKCGRATLFNVMEMANKKEITGYASFLNCKKCANVQMGISDAGKFIARFRETEIEEDDNNYYTMSWKD